MEEHEANLSMNRTQAIEERKTGFSNPLNRPILAVATRFGGSKAKELERFLKFAIVGLIGFVVDFGTVFVLQSTVLPPANDAGDKLTFNVALATSIAFAAAVTSNFTWNRVWTYPDSRSRSIRRQLSQFTVVSIIGWLARTVWISLAYIPAGVLAANLIGVIVVMIWNFFANRYWTYNDVE